MMNLNKRRGTLIILSGPSGSGKGTVLKNFFENYGDKNVKLSVSATTREPRDGEIDGVNYFFISKTSFEKMIEENKFLEWASFCDNFYGTPLSFVDENLENGCDVILEIEVQGALKVMEKRSDAVSVFILPPSAEELEKRLIGRQTESMDVIEKRINQAKWEISNLEKYTYFVVNDTVEEATKNFKAIIDAERLKTEKQKDFKF